MWSCDGSPEYTMSEIDKKERGTDIVLYIDDENKEFLEDSKIESLLKKYCRFLPVPVIFGKEQEWKDGKYVDAITSKEFKDAMNWGVDLIKKGYIKPKPSENVAWDWYKAAFRDGEAAMQTAEVYEISAFADMEDDWGFVMFPYNQDQKGATNKTVPNDNIVVMPSCFDQEKAEKIAFAYDLYTEPVEGYTPHDQILEQYYPQFRDDRAVDETIAMMLEEKHKSTSYLPMISEIDYGDFCYPVYANATTPAKKIEELSTKWDTKISKVNAEYDKFAKEHTK